MPTVHRVLVPEIAKRFDVPIIAAGGIVDDLASGEILNDDGGSSGHGRP